MSSNSTCTDGAWLHACAPAEAADEVDAYHEDTVIAHKWQSPATNVQSSLICRVPNEILSTIFEEVVAGCELEANEYDCWISILAFLRAITAVSHSWQYVALHTPRLWRNIWHGPDRVAMGYYPYQTCLRRSGAVPLRVWCRGLPNIIEILQCLAAIGGLGRVGALFVEDSARPQSVACTQTFLNVGCPNIQHLSVVFFNHLSRTDFVALLRQHSTVRSLRVDYTWLPPDAPDDGSVAVTLPYLERVWVIQRDGAFVRGVLSSLHTPRLVELLIVVEELQRDNHESALFFTCHPFSVIRELSMGLELMNRDIADVLSKSPCVEVLRLFEASEPSYGCSYDDLLLALADTVGTDYVLAPRLHTLTFHAFPITIQALHILIQSRKSHTVPLRAIGFSREFKSEHSVQALALLAKEVEVFEWVPPVWR